jgi:hypothetical protein
MAALTPLHHVVLDAQAGLERARSAYSSAARLYLIAELLQTIVSRPEIDSLHLSAQYEYNDEGGYFRWLHGSVSLAPDAAEADQLDDCWTEGLDVEQHVILELFGIDDVGEGTLTRSELAALAVQTLDGHGGR